MHYFTKIKLIKIQSQSLQIGLSAKSQSTKSVNLVLDCDEKASPNLPPTPLFRDTESEDFLRTLLPNKFLLVRSAAKGGKEVLRFGWTQISEIPKLW